MTDYYWYAWCFELYNLNLYDCYLIIEVKQGLAPQIVLWAFWAAPSNGSRLQHLNGLCRAHCTHWSGATAGVDRQWFSLSSSTRIVFLQQTRLRTETGCFTWCEVGTHWRQVKGIKTYLTLPGGSRSHYQTVHLSMSLCWCNSVDVTLLMSTVNVTLLMSLYLS